MSCTINDIFIVANAGIAPVPRNSNRIVPLYPVFVDIAAALKFIAAIMILEFHLNKTR